MAEQGFPLPGSSYKELIKIIQGYGQVGPDAVPSDVSKIISMHETIVSKNNRFLVAVGIVQGGKKKTITSVGAELAAALQYGMTEEISTKWRQIVESTDFLQKVIAAVRIRKGMDESSLEAHVAYSAGQPKTPSVLAGAGAIVDILKVAGLLAEDGGNLIAAATEPPKQVEPTEPLPTLPLAPPVLDRPIFRSQSRTSGGISLNIEVRIQCGVQELDGLGQKLKKMIEELEKQNEATDADSADGGEK